MRVVNISYKTWPVNTLEQYSLVLPLSERRYLQGCDPSYLISLEILHVVFTSAMTGFVGFLQGYGYCSNEAWKCASRGE